DAEIRACRPWLDAEIALVRPQVIIALGATAAQALLGKQFRVTKDRGKVMPSPLAEAILATVHPSSVLRAPDPEARAQAERAFIGDLKQVARHLQTHVRPPADRSMRSIPTRAEPRAAAKPAHTSTRGVPMAARGRRDAG
ncbi:MAG: hypothetical protein M3125_07345, partial [Gemmatimonadota bacterium]|nr:hypothetical protein [Gemmatimonadota bacterium]